MIYPYFNDKASADAKAARHGNGINAPLNDQGQTALHLAAARGDLDSVDKLLKAAANVAQVDDSGATPLFTAVAHGDLAVIDRLLKAGASWHARNDSGLLAIEQALMAGADAVFLQELRDRGAAFDLHDQKQSRALHIAAELGREDIVTWLVSGGMSVQRTDDMGHTPLHAAITAGKGETVQQLLAFGADPLLRSSNIETPLHAAALKGDIASLHILLAQPEVARRVDEFKTYGQGFTPLLAAVAAGHAEAVRALAAAGADVNVRDNEGRSALFIAVEASKPDMVATLLALGADACKSPAKGETHLMHAIGDENYALTLLHLQAAGVDIDARDGSGQTALHLACEANDPVRALALLDLGADPNVMNEFGKRPIDCVLEHYFYIHKDQVSILARLLARGADPNLSPDARVTVTPLAAAARSGHAESVKMLLDRKARVDETGRGIEDGVTPFMAACAFGRLEVAQVLAAEGAYVQKRGAADLRTALHHAAERGEKDLVEWLLTQPGFAVDTRDSKGMTALHIAAAAGKSDAVALLLARGADPAAYDSNGWTALHHAVREGHEGTVAALLNDEKSPANVNAQTRESGETPLHLAARKGHCDIIDALLAKGADAALLSGAGHVPLHHAIFGSRPLAGEKLLNALQRQKVNINKLRDRTGNSLLHFAAARAHEDLPKLLIAAGADVNAENKDGATPLHFACAAGRNETVLYLAVEKEALHKADKMGRTPASIAKEKGFTEILDLFEAMKAANDNENEKNAQLKNARKPKKPSP